VSTIKEKTTNFLNEINEVLTRCNLGKEALTIIGASKTKDINEIREAYQAGIRHFGENYLQEAEDKIYKLDLDITWHFIGSIQKRKSKKIAHLFDWVHTLERIEVAKKLDKERSELSKKLNVCIQINVDDEKSKSGIAIDEVDKFVVEINNMENLTLRGLMAIPNPLASKENQIKSFKLLKRKFDELQKNYKTVDTLSMGMSADYEPAIAHGSTMVRIGTNIFGKRT